MIDRTLAQGLADWLEIIGSSPQRGLVHNVEAKSLLLSSKVILDLLAALDEKKTAHKATVLSFQERLSRK